MGEIQYFNVSIGDASQATSGIRGHFYEENLPASIRCKLTNNILDNPNEYYGSVIRLSVGGLNIPISQAIIQTPVLDINKTIWSFSLCYDYQQLNPIYSDQTFLIYEPNNDTIPPQNNTQ